MLERTDDAHALVGRGDGGRDGEDARLNRFGGHCRGSLGFGAVPVEVHINGSAHGSEAKQRPTYGSHRSVLVVVGQVFAQRIARVFVTRDVTARLRRRTTRRIVTEVRRGIRLGIVFDLLGVLRGFAARDAHPDPASKPESKTNGSHAGADPRNRLLLVPSKERLTRRRRVRSRSRRRRLRVHGAHVGTIRRV